MAFFKSILIDLVFVVLYYIFYKVLGFEVTVIIVLAQIMSHLTKTEKKETKTLPKGMKSVYYR